VLSATSINAKIKPTFKTMQWRYTADHLDHFKTKYKTQQNWNFKGRGHALKEFVSHQHCQNILVWIVLELHLH